jgi:plasmid maintenance system killer protein
MATNINIGGRHHNFSIRRWISGRGKWHESEDRDAYEARKSVPKEVRADLQPGRYAGRRTKTYEGSGYQFRPREQYRTPGWESYHDQIDNPSPRRSRGLDLVEQLVSGRGGRRGGIDTLAAMSGSGRSSGRSSSRRSSGGAKYQPEISASSGSSAPVGPSAPTGPSGKEKDYKAKYKKLKKSGGDRGGTDAMAMAMQMFGNIMENRMNQDPGKTEDEQQMEREKARKKQIKEAKKISKEKIRGKDHIMTDEEAKKVGEDATNKKVDANIDKINAKIKMYRAAQADNDLGAMSTIWKELELLGADMDQLRQAPKTTTPTAATASTTRAPGDAAADVGASEAPAPPEPAAHTPEREDPASQPMGGPSEPEDPISSPMDHTNQYETPLNRDPSNQSYPATGFDPSVEAKRARVAAGTPKGGSRIRGRRPYRPPSEPPQQVYGPLEEGERPPKRLEKVDDQYSSRHDDLEGASPHGGKKSREKFHAAEAAKSAGAAGEAKQYMTEARAEYSAVTAMARDLKRRGVSFAEIPNVIEEEMGGKLKHINKSRITKIAASVAIEKE